MRDEPIRLTINGYDDRRKIISILGENGYKVRTRAVEEEFKTNYFVEVWLN